MAFKNRKIANELLFHSDRGIQYANKNFANMLDSFKTVTKSMSRKEDCWGNAVAEKLFQIAKNRINLWKQTNY